MAEHDPNSDYFSLTGDLACLIHGMTFAIAVRISGGTRSIQFEWRYHRRGVTARCGCHLGLEEPRALSRVAMLLGGVCRDGYSSCPPKRLCRSSAYALIEFKACGANCTWTTLRHIPLRQPACQRTADDPGAWRNTILTDRLVLRLSPTSTPATGSKRTATR